MIDYRQRSSDHKHVNIPIRIQFGLLVVIKRTCFIHFGHRACVLHVHHPEILSNVLPADVDIELEKKDKDPNAPAPIHLKFHSGPITGNINHHCRVPVVSYRLCRNGCLCQKTAVGDVC